jgi:four helix bundle protein
MLEVLNVRIFDFWYYMAQSLYRQLDIWKLSIEISKQIYLIGTTFPKTETYGIVDQMKQSSVSIASNIAEWSWRGTIQENIHFHHIARWSCAELETQIILSKELWLIDVEKSEELERWIEVLLMKISTYIKTKRSQK